MNLRRWSWCLGLAIGLAVAATAHAQRLGPHVGYVYPAGGRHGGTLEVTVGGQFLDGVSAAYVSGEGVKAEVLDHVKPLTQKQFQALRDRLAELQKKPRSAENTAEMLEIRRKLAMFVRKPANPAIAETVQVKIAVAADAAVGQRELRLETPLGLTNPLVFHVGDLPEFSKPPAKELSAAAGKGAKYRDKSESAGPAQPLDVTLPAIVNGQTMPGGVDRYRFPARKGQRLVIAVSARDLIPYLPDAVPGWFQAALSLYDPDGNELAHADHFRFQPDPVIYYEIPKDGTYAIEIHDSVYRGREDFVYRIAIGELPYITDIFPLGGKVGEATSVELTGWNLPRTKLRDDGKDESPGVRWLSVRKGGVISNRVPFARDGLPECLEQEPNDRPEQAQPVKLPVIVNGRIQQPGDWDVFRIEGQAGQQLVAEVLARRLDSPLDSVLRLTDAAGKQLAFNDDHEDKGSGLNTHHADSYLSLALPADGTYYLYLGEVQRRGGPEYAYRLRISGPQPDFDLRVVPASVSMRGGGGFPLTVYALRKDGFAGPIGLALQGAPPGFTLSGAQVPAGQDSVRLTLSAPPTAVKEPLDLRLEGRGTVAGQEVVRPVVPAEDMMQAFAYRHLVPADELAVVVSDRGMSRAVVKIASTTPVKIPVGGTVKVQINAPARGLLDRYHLDLDDPPEGISLKEVTPGRDGAELVLQSDATVKPGLAGNLIVSAYAGKPQGGKGKGQGNRPNTPVGTLPAIPFETVKP